MSDEPDDPFDTTRSTARSWSCVVQRDQYRDDIVRDIDRVARLAWAGAWEDLFPALDKPTHLHDPELVNTPRVGTRSGYACLHHAAWHGADRAVVERLLDLGAWRTLRTTEGQLPADIARERGHDHLAAVLAVPDELPWALGDRTATERLLHAVMESRLMRDGLDGPFRLPQLGPLREIEPDQFLVCGVPGMYGGFFLRSYGDSVVVESWNRIVEAGEERHRVTAKEARLIDQGWGGGLFTTARRPTI